MVSSQCEYRLDDHLLLVEPLERAVRATRVLVGVRALPVLKVEGGLGEGVEGVLSLGLIAGDSIVLLLILNLLRLLSLGSRGRRGLGLLLLLRERNILQRLLGVLDGAEGLLHGGLVHNSLEVADDIRKLGAEGRIDRDGNGALDDRGDGDVGKRDALSDKEGAGRKVGLEGLQGTELALSKSGVELLQRHEPKL